MNLEWANLEGANLNQVKGVRHASCAFSGHEEGGLLGVEINSEIVYFCGGFQGSEEELLKYIEEGDESYKASHLLALNFVKSAI